MWRRVGWTAAVALFLTSVLSALANDDTEAARLGLPVADINGKPMTIYYFEAAAKRLSRAERAALTSEAGKLAFLNELIADRVQADEAVRRGYNRHETVQVLLKKKLATMMKIVIELPVEEMVPSEEELRQYYNQHLDDYHRPAWCRASHMVFEDEKEAKRVLHMLLTRKPSEEGFRGVGKQVLDMGYFRRPEEQQTGDAKTLPQLAEAAFALEEDGEIYPELIHSEQGYHILMRKGYRPAIVISFERANGRGFEIKFKRALKRQKLKEAIESLKKKYPVVIHEKALMEVVIDP